MDFILEITEETLNNLKHRYYKGNQEIKVGDKVIYGFTEDIINGTLTMTFKPFVLDDKGSFFYELKTEKI
jgi:hypothetical protein